MHAGNENTTETFRYIVTLAGDANLDGIVDIFYVGIVSAP